jgi:hypothetical protein
LANLSFSRFRQGNSAYIDAAGYYIWNGDVNGSFTAVMIDLENGNRYTTTPSLSLSTSLDLIPPLQSFIVKRTGAALTTVKMSPNWTTTSAAETYTLRGSDPIESKDVLRIKASQGNKTSYTALVYKPGTSSSQTAEDMPPVVFDEPLTVYSITPQREPLAINVSGYFEYADVGLGLRVRDAGETKLEFFDLPTFGHKVYLTDHERQTTVNLQETPEYTFTLAKSGTGIVEMNDRFTLHFTYTGTGNSAPVVAASALHVSSANGYVTVQSTGSPITRLQIYNIMGELVYSDNSPSQQYKVSLNRSQIYIVNALIDNVSHKGKVVVN